MSKLSSAGAAGPGTTQRRCRYGCRVVVIFASVPAGIGPGPKVVEEEQAAGPVSSDFYVFPSRRLGRERSWSWTAAATTLLDHIICKKYAKNMLNMQQKYAKNMQKNMQNMHKSMYLHILHIYALPTLLMLACRDRPETLRLRPQFRQPIMIEVQLEVRLGGLPSLRVRFTVPMQIDIE